MVRYEMAMLLTQWVAESLKLKKRESCAVDLVSVA